MRSRALLLLTLAVLSVAATVRGQTNAPGPQLEVRRLPGVAWLEARWPGAVAAAVAIPAGDGRTALAVLSSDSAGGDSRALDVVDPGDGERQPMARRLRQELPASLEVLDGLDVDGDGELELVAGEPHRIYCLGRPRSGELLACELGLPTGLDLRAPNPARLRAAESGSHLLAFAEAGRVRFFRGEAGALEKVAEERLPLQVTRETSGLRLASPPLVSLARDGRAPIWIAGPEESGASRLRLVRLDPESGSAALRTEVWCRLPGAEKVGSSAVVDIDGEPHLAVLTARADKLSVFEKSALRIYPLAVDRTRAGRAPTFVAETGFSRWRAARIEALDLDADGHTDLVLLGPLGLRGEKLEVRVFRGLGAGRFEPKGASLEIEGGDREARIVADLTRDGRPDLLLVDETAVELRAGLPPGATTPFSERPGIRVPLPAPAERGKRGEVTVGNDGVRSATPGLGSELLLADLEGDRRPELVQLVQQDGQGVLRVFHFD